MWCLRSCHLPFLLIISISLQSFEVWTLIRCRRLVILILIFELFVGHVYVSLELKAETVKTIEEILGIMCNCFGAEWSIAISRIWPWFSLRHRFPTLLWVVITPLFFIMLNRRIRLNTIICNIHTLIRIVIIKLVVERGTNWIIPLIRLIFFNLGINDFILIFNSCNLSFIGGIFLLLALTRATRVIIIVIRRSYRSWL